MSEILCKQQDIQEMYSLYNGDSCEVMKAIPDNSIHYSIFSPPFSELYVYSNTSRDLSNCNDYAQFKTHFKFITKELYRVMMNGRLVSLHCMDLCTQKQKDGFIGIHDLSGDLIRMMQEVGFIYHSRITVWKDPVIAMQRTKALGLLYKQLKKDSAMSRQGLADYIITFRKDGENTEKITHTEETFPLDLWKNYASPVWMDINPSNTLQRQSARDEKDEKHMTPTQLDVIERCIELWTNPNDIVFTPFLGIGSEIYQSLLMGRRGVGIELKESYYNQAVSNCKLAIAKNNTKQLF